MEEVVGRENLGMCEMEHLECLSLEQLQLKLQVPGGFVSHWFGWQEVERHEVPRGRLEARLGLTEQLVGQQRKIEYLSLVLEV